MTLATDVASLTTCLATNDEDIKVGGGNTVSARHPDRP